MKPHIYVIHKCHHRTLEKIAVIVGVVLAETEETAVKKAWEKSGGDTCSLELIEEIPEDGYSYYMPCRQSPMRLDLLGSIIYTKQYGACLKVEANDQ